MSGLIVWLASLHCVLGQRSNLSESATDRLLNYPPPFLPPPSFFLRLLTSSLVVIRGRGWGGGVGGGGEDCRVIRTVRNRGRMD